MSESKDITVTFPRFVPLKDGLNYNHSDWYLLLKNNIQEFHFQGDIEKASQLLDCFCIGVKYVKDAYSKVGAKPPFPPQLGLNVDSPEKTPMAGTTKNGSLIIVNLNSLAKISILDFHKTYQFLTTDDEIGYVGSAKQMMTLAGIEEGSHCAILQTGLITIVDKYWQYAGLTGSEEDASEVEQIGLAFQLDYAQKFMFPPKSIASIKNRIDKGYTHRIQGETK